VRVDADAGDVHEQPAFELADVDETPLRFERRGNRQLRFAADAKLGGEAVAGAGRDDAQRDVAERERGRHLVDRAVAAPGHHQPHAALHRRLRQLARVTAAFGDEDLRPIAVALDDPGGDLRAMPRRLRPCAARNWIDDDRDRHEEIGKLVNW
jgi:hypothetical protein